MKLKRKKDLQAGTLCPNLCFLLVLDGHTVYNVANGSLLACFDENINLDTVQAIIKLGSAGEPILRIVLRDSSFANDIVKINAIQRFKQAGIEDVLSI